MYDLIDVRMTRTGPHGPVDVLRDIDLHVPTGQVVAVHGSDVAARAALVRVLTGLERPSSGSVRFNDESLAVMTTKRLAQVRARELGLVPHPPRLLDRLTAEENVELGLAARASTRQTGASARTPRSPPSAWGPPGTPTRRS